MNESRGGDDMTKNTQKSRFMIVGAAVVLVVAAIAWVGLSQRADNQDATGAIGAAARYQDPQIESSDVSVQDADLVAFMQTETFDRLMNDAELRNFVTSEEYQMLVNDEAYGRMLEESDLDRVTKALGRVVGDEDVRRRVRMLEFQRVLDDPLAVRVIEDEALSRHLKEREQLFRDAVSDQEFNMAIQDEYFIRLLRHRPRDMQKIYESEFGRVTQKYARLFDDAGTFERFLGDEEVGRRVRMQDTLKMLASQEFNLILQEPELAKAMRQQGFKKLVSNEALDRIGRHDKLKAFVMNEELARRSLFNKELGRVSRRHKEDLGRVIDEEFQRRQRMNK